MRRVVVVTIAILIVGGITWKIVDGARHPVLSQAASEHFFADAFGVYLLTHRTPAGLGTWRARCKPVLQDPTPARRAAVERVVRWVAQNGDHETLDEFGDGRRGSGRTVREIIRGSADDIAECARHVHVPEEWRTIERRLHETAA